MPYEFHSATSIDAHHREILILRTCARCGAEYEWGVHAVSFPRFLEIPEAQVHATATAAADDPVWTPEQRLLVRLADELHDTAHVSDALWNELAALWSEVQLLDLAIAVADANQWARNYRMAGLAPELFYLHHVVPVAERGLATARG